MPLCIFLILADSPKGQFDHGFVIYECAPPSDDISVSVKLEDRWTN